MGFVSTLNLDQYIRTTTGAAIDRAAEKAAEIEKFAVSEASGPRSGKKYAGSNKRASINIERAEFPQEDTSEFHDSIKAIKGGAKMEAKVGSFGADTEKQKDLEFGNPSKNFAARAPQQRIMESQETHIEMDKAAGTV